MPAIQSFDKQQLLAICAVLGDTNNGLTGSEIGMLLRQCNIDDPKPGATKRDRLYSALTQRQMQDQCGNNVVAYIQAAMAPVRYVNNRPAFEYRRNFLNQVLSFPGYHLGSDGVLRPSTPARTLSEAEQRASRLKIELQKRTVHPDVLRFCQAQLLQDNYFHAVLEATKSVADKIREKTGLTSDGSELVDEAFGLRNGPKLAFNTLRTANEESEHKGLMNLVKGIFGTFRNPTAHAPQITWVVNEQDALDLLTMVSYIHRRLDQAAPTGK